MEQLKRTNSLIKKNEKKKEEPTSNQESRKVIKQRKKVQQQELKTRNVPLIVKYSQLLSDEPGEERYRLHMFYLNTNIRIRKIVPAGLIKNSTVNVSGIVHDGCTAWPPNIVSLDQKENVLGFKWLSKITKQEVGMADLVLENVNFYG
ncbi:hypothetical protein BC833DRAFT_625960 [Globomyces pollinis-pini]|nr:hypothetical protein BC833DRAFT_625960 [Globomyces pollinis-pini]